MLRLENRFLRKELGNLIGGEANIDIPPVEELERTLGIPSMTGQPGTITGGDENPADEAFPSILRKGAGAASQNFGSKPGAKLKNLAKAKHLQGNTAVRMMRKDYEKDVEQNDALTSMETELEQLRADNARLRFHKEQMDRHSEKSMMKHNNLMNKLANLESVFIGDMDDEEEDFEQ